jgi:two-component system cell cycle sensor histidine kinase/response regulator CckA
MAQDLKKSRDEIVSSKEFSENILRSMFSALIIVSEKGAIQEVNQFGLELLGYTKNELLNQGVDLILSKERPLQGGWLNNLIKIGSSGNAEGVLITKGGRELPALFSGSVLLNNTGEIQGIVFVAKDLSELKKSEEEKMRLEAQLQQIQKLEAIGTLAGGVAHDLNNILAGIVSYPELMLLDLPEESPLRKPILTIMESGQKAAVIVNDLLTLARRGVKISDVVNLNNIVSDYLHSPEYDNLKKSHPGIELGTNLDPELFNISGSPVHLFKTIMNLVINSSEAISGNGEIQISTSNQYIDRPIKGYEDVQEGDYVVLSVTDSGMGISREDLPRIFEPFYTKKVMGRSGTGLGMPVVLGTVKDHNGYIDIQSAVGEGTRCNLYFPVTKQEQIHNKTTHSLEAFRGKETILVIDDIQEQREIANEILSWLGYSVTTLSSGEEAIEYMQKNSADLLILDMIMDPGIDGMETYKRILEFHPGQKAIIASGFSETGRVKEAQKLGTSAYLKKPYSLQNIGKAVRAVLDR